LFCKIRGLCQILLGFEIEYDHVKCWCSPHWLLFIGDFDGLDIFGLWFLKPQGYP